MLAALGHAGQQRGVAARVLAGEMAHEPALDPHGGGLALPRAAGVRCQCGGRGGLRVGAVAGLIAQQVREGAGVVLLADHLGHGRRAGPRREARADRGGRERNALGGARDR